MKPWRTDQWFVSPWNYLEEITAQHHFQKDIQIHDVTLRDGEQMIGVSFNYDDKLAIAEKLAELGVHRIEVGMPASSQDDERALRELVKRDLGGSEIYAFSRCMISDVQKAIDCGARNIITEVPSSRHMIERAYEWTVERAIETAVETTAFASRNGLKTVFFTIDASRADMPFLLSLMDSIVKHGQADGLVLVDTYGVLMPDSIRYFVRSVREKFPDMPLEIHCHNDFSLAVANTITALSLGVKVAHTCVAGLGAKAGGCALEELVMALKLLYGVELGIKTEGLRSLAALVAGRAGISLPANKGIVGEDIYKIESGIPSAWYRRLRGTPDITLMLPYLGSLTGHNEPEPVLGKGSGEATLDAFIKDLRMDIPPEDVRPLVLKIKERGLEKKGLLDLGDFRKIVADYYRDRGPENV